MRLRDEDLEYAVLNPEDSDHPDTVASMARELLAARKNLRRIAREKRARSKR